MKNWLIWKDPDAGKDWRQEQNGMTEDEMVGWHHQWVWVGSGSWWWTGRPGLLQSMGSQSWMRLSHWTELNWGLYFIVCLCLKLFMDVWLQLCVKRLKVRTLILRKRKKLNKLKSRLFKRWVTELRSQRQALSQTGETRWFRESQLRAANLEQKSGKPVVGRRREIAGRLMYVSWGVRSSVGESSVGTPTVSSVLPLGGP